MIWRIGIHACVFIVMFVSTVFVGSLFLEGITDGLSVNSSDMEGVLLDARSVGYQIIPKETPAPVYRLNDPGIFQEYEWEMPEYTPSQYELDLEKRITNLERGVKALQAQLKTSVPITGVDNETER